MGKVPSPLPLLTRPAPAPYFHPLIFQIPPLWGRYLKFTHPPFKKEGRV